MTKETPKVIYLVEGEKIVTSTQGGVLEIEKYEKKITYLQVSDKLFKYNFKVTQEFLDWYIYSNAEMEIDVILNSEADYYAEKSLALTLEEYCNLVMHIVCRIKKPIKIENIKILYELMQIFGLNAYSMEEKKHYKNIEELKQGLSRLGLLAK